MGYNKTIELYCDKCTWAYADGHSITVLRWMARSDGWRCNRQGDICKDCLEKERDRWKENLA